MKKLFIISALAIGTSLSLFSCNNGPYDVNPGQDNSAVLNPLDPNSGVTVYLRTMKARINGIEVVFDRTFFQIDTSNIRRIFAYSTKDSVHLRRLSIVFPENTYLGIDTYKIGFEPGVSFEYSYYDTGSKMLRYFDASPSQNNKDGVMLTVAGEEGGHMRGVMKAEMYQTRPDVNTSQMLYIEGEYYAERRPFPFAF